MGRINSFIGIILAIVGVFAIVVGVAFAVFVVISTLADAHMHDRADLNSWMKGLKNNQGGQCCDFLSEARKIEDPDYEALPDGSGDYRVKIDGAWYKVSKDRVVKGPNMYGPALAWPYTDNGGITQIRCFLPGSGT